MKTLSKSRYIEGQKCTLALWFNTHNQPVTVNNNTPVNIRANLRLRNQGSEIGKLAQGYFPGGVEVKAAPDDLAGAIRKTKSFIRKKREVIFEATAGNPGTGTNARIDVLRKVPGTDAGIPEWDMVEVKSTMTAKEYHYEDLAFQRHVFESAGYKIRNCYLMLIERDYVLQGQLDLQKLFRLQDVTKKVSSKDVAANIQRMIPIMADNAPKPDEPIGKICLNPYPCEHKAKCWSGVPLYSTFNVAADDVSAEVKKRTGAYDIAGLLPETAIKPEKKIEIAAYQNQQVHIDQPKLQEFLGVLKYPVYYLDYETVMAPVPFYQGTKPFQQVPFQLSVHSQESKNGPVIHCGFIHQDRDDPRENFTKALIALCSDKGSVIVYSPFEAERNTELARDFPQYAKQLKAINRRIVDLYEPFKHRWLYHPDQNGGASIKAVLPAFTKLSYKNLNINNGEQALQQYLSFVTGETTDPAEVAKLFEDLDEYCGLDTFAMVELLRVIRELAGPPVPQPALSP